MSARQRQTTSQHASSRVRLCPGPLDPWAPRPLRATHGVLGGSTLVDAGRRSGRLRYGREFARLDQIGKGYTAGEQLAQSFGGHVIEATHDTVGGDRDGLNLTCMAALEDMHIAARLLRT